MPATYEPIATTTLGSAASSYTFSSISSAYTDLVLVINGYAVTQENSVLCQVGNGSADTGSNYSTTTIAGTGSSAVSNRNSGQTYMRFQSYGGLSTSSSNPAVIIAQFLNYQNTTTYKTVLSRANQTSGTYPAVEACVNLWRSTSAIDTIKVFPFTGASFATGTTLTLYGIKAA